MCHCVDLWGYQCIPSLEEEEERRERRQQRQKQKALRSSLIQDLRNELLDAPEEVHVSHTPSILKC